MSVNKYLPHVFVLPEDDANRQLANGFLLEPSLRNRKIQILEEAGGWQEVLNRFRTEHVPLMDRTPNRHMVLLIDFDGREDRLGAARAAIPSHLAEKVFVLGAWTNPEQLRQSLGRPYEAIGLEMAKDCLDERKTTWGHRLLGHNASEVERLRNQVRPILFSDA